MRGRGARARAPAYSSGRGAGNADGTAEGRRWALVVVAMSGGGGGGDGGVTACRRVLKSIDARLILFLQMGCRDVTPSRERIRRDALDL